jgi:hypothetical protein
MSIKDQNKIKENIYDNDNNNAEVVKPWEKLVDGIGTWK